MARGVTRAAAVAAAVLLGVALALAALVAPASAASARPALVGGTLGSGYHDYTVSASLLSLCPLGLLDSSSHETSGAWMRSSNDSVVAEGVVAAASSAGAAARLKADERTVSRCAPAGLVDGTVAVQTLRVVKRTATSTTWSERVTTLVGDYRGYVAVGRAGRDVVVLGWGLGGSVSLPLFTALLHTALARA